MRTRTTARGRAPIAALTLLGLALLVGACGGGAIAADEIGDPNAQAAAEVLLENDGDAPEGEYADEVAPRRAPPPARRWRVRLVSCSGPEETHGGRCVFFA
jgi:hypothetical protein